MNHVREYVALLFNSVSHAMMAEKILKEEGISHKLIPVPRHISSDCGVCLRIELGDEEKIRKLLDAKVEITGRGDL
ncbi:MAG TPA: DUF3343 domain-containing protein [Desulfomonilia bacterium]|jgi:hypothetical protein